MRQRTLNVQAMRRHHRRLAATVPVALVTLVALVALAGCAAEVDEPLDRRPAPPPEGGRADGAAAIDWVPCGALECATLAVPLDHDEPDGETILIDVVRSPATGARIGPLFMNPGGPGGSATALVNEARLALPEEVVERFDLVGVDPRGLGSSDLDCGVEAEILYRVDLTIDEPADRDALLGASSRYAQGCWAAHGSDLAHFGTRDVARDMDAVRAAMGDDQLSFLGLSYGSVIGQVYAEMFPERVRAMVLDGIVDLGTSGIEQAKQQAAGFELALSRFARWCEETSCAAGPDVLAVVEGALGAAEAPGGIPAPGANRPAGPGEVVLGLALPLYSETLWPQLAAALAGAARADASGLVALADIYLGLADFDVFFAVNCIDLAWPQDPEELLAGAVEAGRAHPRFGEAILNGSAVCPLWPVESDPLPALDAAGAAPILLVSTTGDPATPHSNAIAAAERLAEAALLTHEGEGHTVTLDAQPCVDAAVTTYLLHLRLPAKGATC